MLTKFTNYDSGTHLDCQPNCSKWLSTVTEIIARQPFLPRVVGYPRFGQIDMKFWRENSVLDSHIAFPLKI
jgi:hypothetical protein